MPNTAKKSETLEILISTMHKDSFTFLEHMFPKGIYKEFNILIINQTTKEKQLLSSRPNIRVINSFETGLALSRNLAIKNATGDVCLLADDDIVYKPNFDQIILNAFSSNAEADIITFKMVDEKGSDFKSYVDIKRHNEETVKKVNSVVIGLRRKNILNSEVLFNPLFGLNAMFKTGDEYVFLRDALKAKLAVFFEPKIILSHNYLSSGRYAGSDDLVYARAAIFYKYSGVLGYLKVIKYVFLIYNKGQVNISQILSKLAIGFKGISDYRKISA